MTYHEAQLLTGAIAILTLTALWGRVLVGHWWCRYGKQAGLAWIFIGLVFGSARIADLLGFGSADTRSQLATYSYVIAVCYMAQITTQHIRHHWHERRIA